MLPVYIGYDSRELQAYRVCVESLRAHARDSVAVQPISSRLLGPHYRRPETRREGKLFDEISQAPMATEFSLARFFVPFIQQKGWAVYCDCDFLWRAPVDELFETVAQAGNDFAVLVVKHSHQPLELSKMDGQLQTAYARKNWSSLILWNCSHEANRCLSTATLNTVRGLGLHQFNWLPDEQIGELGLEWNWLAGLSPAEAEPKAVHFTLGTPDMKGYEEYPYAKEWREYAQRFVALSS